MNMYIKKINTSYTHYISEVLVDGIFSAAVNTKMCTGGGGLVDLVDLFSVALGSRLSTSGGG